MALINACTNPKYCEYIEYYSKMSDGIYSLAENIQLTHLAHLLEREILDYTKVSPVLLEKVGFAPPVEFTNINVEGIKHELEKLEYGFDDAYQCREVGFWYKYLKT